MRFADLAKISIRQEATQAVQPLVLLHYSVSASRRGLRNVTGERIPALPRQPTITTSDGGVRLRKLWELDGEASNTEETRREGFGAVFYAAKASQKNWSIQPR